MKRVVVEVALVVACRLKLGAVSEAGQHPVPQVVDQDVGAPHRPVHNSLLMQIAQSGQGVTQHKAACQFRQSFWEVLFDEPGDTAVSHEGTDQPDLEVDHK